MPPDILMPALSPTMEEGKLAKWHVKEGDRVKPGDILAEIETDKATMEFEAIDEGTIEKLLVPEGAEAVKINAPIARLTSDQSAPAKPSKPAEPAPRPSAPAPQRTGVKSAPATAAPAAAPKVKGGNGATAPATDHRLFASPLAKRIARDHQVELAQLQGSGPRGRIVKADVDRAIEAGVRPQMQTPTVAAQPRPDTLSAGGGANLAPLPDARLFYPES